MHILVTGGAGFIGSHLVMWLVQQGHRVRVLDNFSTGFWHNLAPVQTAIEVITGDICDSATVQTALTDVDVVFHLAAMISVVQSVEEPLRAHAINATGSLHVLDAAARTATVRRVVQMSSSAIYGNNEALPLAETAPPQPLSPYAATKLTAEQYGQLYTHLYQQEVVALRGFNIYGPRQDPSSPYASVIPRFITALHTGKQPTIFGDGLQSRDFIFVGDVVAALWHAATTDSMAGGVFNIGRGEQTTIVALAAAIAAGMKSNIQPTFAPPRAGEVRHSCADVQRLTESGFTARTPLSKGLEDTIAYYVSMIPS